MGDPWPKTVCDNRFPPRPGCPATRRPRLARRRLRACGPRCGADSRLGRRGCVRLAHRYRRIVVERQRQRRTADLRHGRRFDRRRLRPIARSRKCASSLRRRHAVGQARRRRWRALSNSVWHPAGSVARKRGSGSRIAAAGLRARTVVRRERTACCASSTSATSTNAELTFLARHDGLTGELNRHYLTEILEDTLEDAIRFRSSCGFPSGGGRQSVAHQRVVWLRHR